MSTNLTLSKGHTGPFTVTVSHTKLGATGLLPYHSGLGALYFYGKLDVSDPDTLTDGKKPGALFKKTLLDGISVTVDGNNTDTDGVLTITLAPADTAVLPSDAGSILVYCSLTGYDGSNWYPITIDVDLAVNIQPTSGVTS